MKNIYTFRKDSFKDITDKSPDERGLDEKIFGSCHTVRGFGGG